MSPLRTCGIFNSCCLHSTDTGNGGGQQMHQHQLYPVLRAAVYTVCHQLTQSHKCSGKPDKAAVMSLLLTPKKSIKQWRETLISPEKGRNTESNQCNGLLWRVDLFHIHIVPNSQNHLHRKRGQARKGNFLKQKPSLPTRVPKVLMDSPTVRQRFTISSVAVNKMK